MRKYITSNGTFYYPEETLNLIDTEEAKITVENPVGYVEGDLVRMFYTFAANNIQVGVNTFEMFSPLVKDGAILRAVFYLPLSAEFTNDYTFQSSTTKRTEFFIKAKGSTDFDNIGYLHRAFSFIYLITRDAGVRSNPISVFFFSERGAGLFENKILNRQFRVADTNFSSVAIRQDKFNPYVMDIGGRNLILGTNTGDWVPWQAGLSTILFSEGVLRITSAASGTGQRAVQSIVNNRKSKLISGETYTLSLYVRGTIIGASLNYTYLMNTGVGNQLIYSSSDDFSIGSETEFKKIKTTFIANPLTSNSTGSYILIGHVGEQDVGDWFEIKDLKIEKGDIATDWTPGPEDYEVTEVISGADLAGGLDKFNSSYAFKLLDDSEWVTKKLICPENYIQLFWGEPRSETRFSFWFKIKEIEKSSEAWGEVEHYRELRGGTDVKERRKDVTKYRFPKTKLRLTSGVFRQDIIDKLKGIAHSTTIYKYNPYTKLNEGRGVIAQVTEVRGAMDGLLTPQVGTGHFELNDIYTHSNTIEDLINSPESVFDLEFSFKGSLRAVHFIQNRDDSSKSVLISNSITEPDFTKKTFNGSITIDRSRIVKPALRFRVSTATPTEIKDIYIKGSLGGIEDVEVEIATMNIIPRQDGESEMELTVISDDFRKPDYLYF